MGATLCNKLLQTSWLQTLLFLWFRILDVDKMSPSLQKLSQIGWAGSLPRSHSRLLVEFTFLWAIGLKPHIVMRCWSEASLRSFYMCPTVEKLRTWHLASWEEASERQERAPQESQKERACQQDVWLCRTISEVTIHDFCRIMLITMSISHVRENDYRQECRCQQVRTTRNHVRSCLKWITKTKKSIKWITQYLSVQK